MHRSRLHVLLFVLLAACGGSQKAPAGTPPPNVTSVEIYQADDWRAEVAYLEEPKTALIRFTGNESEIDGIPLVYHYETTDYGKRWVTQVLGAERSVLYAMRNAVSGDAPWRLHAPNSRDNRFAQQIQDIPPELGSEIASQYARLLDAGEIDRVTKASD